SWPVVTWAYGFYWQRKLSAAWAAPRPGSATRAPGGAAEPAVEPLPFARLEVPSIHLQATVVDGIDAVALRRGPGHLPKTCGPGESGDCVIAAHRDGWFRDLQQI